MQQGYDSLSSAFGQGRDALNSSAANASALYAPLINSATAGANAYGDASGANGAAGNARAVANFQQGPGFNAALTTGLQAIDRGAASRGIIGSGNTIMGEQKYGNDLANQGWTTYLNGLAPYLGQQNAATAGAAGVQTGLGNGLNASYQGQGAAGNANYTGQGASNAAATMNRYNVGNNILGAITGVGGLIGGAIGGAGGIGGGLFSGLTGNADGGTAANPAEGLSPSDYGIGSNAGGIFDRFGMSR